MIMPLGDMNRPGARWGLVTWSLIAINGVVFFMELSLGKPFIYGYSTIPKEITEGRDLEEPTVLTVRGFKDPSSMSLSIARDRGRST